MDRWKDGLKSERKESGFENLKARFQDCNLSRKQESKPDGMIERKLSFNRESKLSAKKTSCLCGMMKTKNKKENRLSLQKGNNHSGFRAFNMERKKTIRQSERME